MGQSAAQPILNLRDKLTGALDKLRSWDKPIGKKQDTSWHDQMVKTANESFTKKGAGAKVAPKPAAKPAKKKSAAKRYAR